MKKLMIGFMMASMCLFVSAGGPGTVKKHVATTETTDSKPMGTKRAKTNSLNTPGYYGSPKPHAPHRHSNPMPKLIARPEGTNTDLQPR